MSRKQLHARSVRYFSGGDEAAFFEWLDKITPVVHYEGRGDTLYIDIDLASVDEDSLRELIALFNRYEVDLKQLEIFDRIEFADWFRNSRAYWFQRIFGPSA